MKLEDLKESSLSRLYRRSNNHSAGAISAERNTLTKKENAANTKKLLAKLLKLGYSVTRVLGGFIENHGSPDQKEVANEVSYWVVNDKVEGDDNGQLEADLVKLGEYFDQDAILIKPYGQNPKFIGTSSRDNAWPAKGETSSFDGVNYGDPKGEYFSKIRGRKFAYESIVTENINPPETRNGWIVISKLADEVDIT